MASKSKQKKNDNL